jgi:hypothetical protein
MYKEKFRQKTGLLPLSASVGDDGLQNSEDGIDVTEKINECVSFFLSLRYEYGLIIVAKNCLNFGLDEIHAYDFAFIWG